MGRLAGPPNQAGKILDLVEQEIQEFSGGGER
jgi:hypothetical protein